MFVTYIYDKKGRRENVEICQLKKGEIAYISSRLCAEKKCDLFKEADRIYKDFHPYTIVGSPGFSLCRQMGGLGQIVKLTKGANTLETERCLSGKEFIEISYLIDEYKSYWQSFRLLNKNK